MSNYFEKRIKNGIYKTYNSLEERNIELLKFYKKASDEIQSELYKITSKVQKGKEISLSEMHRSNRLHNLQKKYNETVRELASATEVFGKESMKEGFKAVYSDISTTIGNIDFALPDDKMMENIMKRPWRGSYFSKRVWGNAKLLGTTLNDTLRIGLQQGKTIAQIAIELDNVMQKGFNRAHTLVRTETMHFLNQSSLQAYQDAGITHVKDVVTMDERTSSECAQHNGKIYPIEKAPILPRHPNCRCTLIAVVDEEGIDKVEDVVYDKLKGDDVEVFFAEQKGYQKWMGALDDEKKKIINTYTLDEHVPINNILRMGFDEYIADALHHFNDDVSELPYIKRRAEEYRKEAEFLLQALEGFKADKSFKVYRGTGDFGNELSKLKVGEDQIIDKGFLSTTVDIDQTEKFLDDALGTKYLFEIMVKKGSTSGAYIGELSDEPEEKEFLFKPGTKFHVLSIEQKENGMKLIKMEVD